MKEICRLENVSKTYDEIEGNFIIKEINLSINKGDFISIEGNSGTGKSTLLHLMGGILTPTSGNIFYYNTNINKLSDNKISDLRSTKISYILQEFSFIQSLNIKENLLFIAKINKTNNTVSIENKIDYYLKRLKIYNKKDSFPYQLSGGQKRRVMIIAAILKDPDIIFADEPTNDLDEEISNEIVALLKEEICNSKAVVMVTHNTEISKHINIRYKINNGYLEQIL
ncbi:ABC transporter ATP-binding protein [uncultured Clostridium sp.]|uniref:ABC transporter ATP-binding protein n=1 Tax=uncultured Clostridium sp. TaxID=59620 RepID=UPI0025908570|nr:ABC transporter ATP-binding protein [uncultured Clostridium sp.]